MQGYERDPRSVAKRAEEYLKSTGIADVAYFGPENEFFIFDDVRYSHEMHQTFYKIDSSEGSWNTGTEMPMIFSRAGTSFSTWYGRPGRLKPPK